LLIILKIRTLNELQFSLIVSALKCMTMTAEVAFPKHSKATLEAGAF